MCTVLTYDEYFHISIWLYFMPAIHVEQKYNEIVSHGVYLKY